MSRLTDVELHRLEGQLKELRCLLTGPGRPPQAEVAASALVIIRSVEGKLVSREWQSTWRGPHCELTTGWFGDVVVDEVASALHGAFTTMARLVMEGRTPLRQRKYADELAHALSDYFYLRGYDEPGQGDQEEFLDFPAQQRQLLIALRENGKVSIKCLIHKLFPESRSPTESLHRLKTRTNKSLAERETGLEIRKEGQTYALVPV